MITIKNDKLQIKTPTNLLELSKNYNMQYPILLANVNNRLKSLSEFLYPENDYRVEFLDITNMNGYRVYQRSIVFIMIYAIKKLHGEKQRVIIEHSINKNYYCEIPEREITDEFLSELSAEMNSIVKSDLPIEKLSLPIETAMTIMKRFGADEPFRYNYNSNVSLYKLDWYYDYFYGPMLPSTGYVKDIVLHKKLNGFVIQFPAFDKPYELDEIKSNDKISKIFIESSQWLKILNLSTVNSLNQIISQGNDQQLIHISEALHEKNIAGIADMIHTSGKNIVLIDGPTSSGKTTFAKRLCIQLRVNGLTPHVISIDDYFLNREDSPRDEFGKPNFECVEALDIKQLNNDLTDLLSGKTVQIPRFNFFTGHRESSGRFIKLNPGDVLVMEGIHGLNEVLTQSVPKHFKFKIFISALTQLNINDHNRIGTTDTRLIRRIVRDNQFRGFKAKMTIDMWSSVGRGENKYIFPYQEEADVFFNSALLYELSVLKEFAKPLLVEIKDNEQEYTEAHRLIRFLDSFIGINSEHIPRNSLLREFIGGGCF